MCYVLNIEHRKHKNRQLAEMKPPHREIKSETSVKYLSVRECIHQGVLASSQIHLTDLYRCRWQNISTAPFLYINCVWELVVFHGCGTCVKDPYSHACLTCFKCQCFLTRVCGRLESTTVCAVSDGYPSLL